MNSICSLWETTQTLFWAVFGLVDLDSFELDGIKIFTRFWGMLMFGCYSVINIVVLLNLLIAMMNHSYQLISVGTQKKTNLTGANWIGNLCQFTFKLELTLKNVIFILAYLRLFPSSVFSVSAFANHCCEF